MHDDPDEQEDDALAPLVEREVAAQAVEVRRADHEHEQRQREDRVLP